VKRRTSPSLAAIAFSVSYSRLLHPTRRLLVNEPS
jgi:hypothetical protein